MDDESRGGAAAEQTSLELQALRGAIDDLRRRPVSVDADQLRSVIIASLSEAAAPPPNLLVTAIRRLDRIEVRLEAIESHISGGALPAAGQSSGRSRSGGSSVVAQPMVLPAADPEAIAEALAKRLASTYRPAPALTPASQPPTPWMVADVVAAVRPLIGEAAREVLERGGHEPSSEALALLQETALAALEKAASVLAPLADLAPPLDDGVFSPTGSQPPRPPRPTPPPPTAPTAPPFDARLLAETIATRVIEIVGRPPAAADPAVLSSAVATEVVRRIGSQTPAQPPERPLGGAALTALLEAVARVESEVSRVTVAPDAVIGALSRLESGIGALAVALEDDRDVQTRALSAGLEEAGDLALAQARAANVALTAVEDRLVGLAEAVQASLTSDAPDPVGLAVQALGPAVEEIRSGLSAFIQRPPVVDPMVQALGVAVEEIRSDVSAFIQRPPVVDPMVQALGVAVEEIRSDVSAFIQRPPVVDPMVQALGVAVEEIRSDVSAFIQRPPVVDPMVQALGVAIEEMRSDVVATVERAPAVDPRVVESLAEDVAAQRAILADAVAEIRALASSNDVFMQLERRIGDIEIGISGLLEHAVAIQSADPTGDAASAIARQEERLGELLGAVGTLRSTLGSLHDMPAAVERTSGRLVAALPDAVASTVGEALDPLLAQIATRQVQEAENMAAIVDRITRLEALIDGGRQAIDAIVTRVEGVDEAIRARPDPLPALAVLTAGVDQLAAACAKPPPTIDIAPIERMLSEIALSIDLLPSPADPAVLTEALARITEAQTALASLDSRPDHGPSISATLHALAALHTAVEAQPDPSAALNEGLERLSLIERMVQAQPDLALTVTARITSLETYLRAQAERVEAASADAPDVATAEELRSVAEAVARLGSADAATAGDLRAVAEAVARLEVGVRDLPDSSPQVAAVHELLTSLHAAVGPLTDRIEGMQEAIGALPERFGGMQEAIGALPERIGSIDEVGERIAAMQAEVREASSTSSDAAAQQLVTLGERLLAIEDAVRTRADVTTAIAGLRESLASLLERMPEELGPELEALRTQGDEHTRRFDSLAGAIDVVGEGLAGLDLSVGLMARAEPTEASLRTLASDVERVAGAVDELVAKVMSVRARVDATAGVVDIGRRAADAGESAVAALAALRGELVDLGAGSARTTDQASSRLAALVEASVTHLTERIDNLAGQIERG